MGKRNPLIIGGIALFLGFSIFMTLLVNNYNELVLNTKPDNYVKQLLTTTSEYLYLSVFVAFVLILFTILLFFAAKTNLAPKIISNLIIGLSLTIVLTAIYFLFQKEINEKIKDSIVLRLISNFVFLIPCLLKDFIDYIYFEVRKTPKVVFYVLLVQIFILLNIFVLPMIGKSIYLNQKEDPELGNKITFEKESLKKKINKYKLAIKLIKNYNPSSSSVKLIKVNYDSLDRKNFDPKIIDITHSVFLINNSSSNTGSSNDYGTASPETMKKFCMKSTGGSNKLTNLREKGELEYKGELNILNNMIKWHSMKTVNGFDKVAFGTVSQQNKCNWKREDYENEINKSFIKKYFGGVDNDNKENLQISPTDISNVPMNLEQLFITFDDEKKKCIFG